MKGVMINGVEYQSALTLAKQFRYTTDYIGQLCRAKKIDAQLVGRSWYVNPVSLTAHKKARYAKTSLGENITEKANEITLSRLEVEPVISKNTVKMSPVADKNFAKRIDWKPLKYEADAGDLIPEFKPETEIRPRRVLISLAESTELSIKTSAKPTKMVAEDLPTVSLKGRLNIASLDEEFATTEETEASFPAVPQPIDEPDSKLRLIHHPSLPTPSREKAPNFHKKAILLNKPVPSELFIPKSVLKNETEEENGIEFIEVTLVTASGLLVLCLLLLFFGESSIEANSVSYSSGIDFSTESLTALTSFFSH